MAASSFPKASLCFFLLLSLCVSSLSSETFLSDSDKVSLAVYYESLCPYSANFIVNYLEKVVEDDDLMSIIDVYLSPWGNARIRGNNTFDCQHGPYECLLNTVEACAIHVWPELTEHFPFINCIETLVYEHKWPEWETCFQELGLNPQPIADCYSSGDGKELELQYAAGTEALEPPHQYVPWVVVDGQPLYEDYENFVNYICKAYNGTATPKACSELSRSIKTIKASSNTPVCYKETPTPTLSGRIKSAILLWTQQMKKAAS